MDPKLYPTASQAIPDNAVDTSPTGTDKIQVIRGNNLMKAITLDNLFASFPDVGGTSPGKVIADALNIAPVTVSTAGALTIAADKSVYFLNHTTIITATVAAPEVGKILIIEQIDGGTAGHTVTLTAGTWNGSHTIATFGTQFMTLMVLGVTATRFMILKNIGTVTFS